MSEAIMNTLNHLADEIYDMRQRIEDQFECYEEFRFQKGNIITALENVEDSIDFAKDSLTTPKENE